MELHSMLIHLKKKKTLTLLRCQSCPRWPTDSMQFLSKFKWHFFSFCRKRKTQPKFHMKYQRTPIVKTILKKNKTKRLRVANSKTYYKTTVRDNGRYINMTVEFHICWVLILPEVWLASCALIIAFEKVFWLRRNQIKSVPKQIISKLQLL